MLITRRELLKAGLGAAALSAIPKPVVAYFGAGPEPVPPIQDPRVKELALRAVEAALSAGATYADVRLTHTRVGREQEDLTAGVRALVDGYWGFCGGAIWSPEEMGRLGREAARQARVMAMGPAREITLAPAPPVRDGHWAMPVEIDPFEISPSEIRDFMESLEIFVSRFPGFRVRSNRVTFQVQEKAFASSEGSYCTQRVYLAAPRFLLSYSKDGREVVDWLDRLTPAGMGFEIYKGEPSIREDIERLMEELKEDWALPVKPVEVGRYDVVCDAYTVGRLASETLGQATELDRALGYEANAGGTSYLNDPGSMIGSFEVGAPALSLRANRSERGGAATVHWDDEGVEPDEFALVEDGVLKDYQTTREGAGWLAESYASQGRPVRSHGCAYAPSAVDAPLTHRPNLVVAPGTEALDFDSAIASLGQGIAVRKLDIDMDFQGLNGLGVGRFYEVKDGKRVARLAGAGLLFRAPELWKGLRALGGPESLYRYGMRATKGEPPQSAYHSVTAPPAVFEQLTIIDVLRKA